MNLAALKFSLRHSEGLELKPYTDTTGHLTIGIGKNLDSGITEKQAWALLDLDIETAINELDRNHPSWVAHDDTRQNVLIELMFNMGPTRLKLFQKMWAALDRADYSTAADEMMDSLWARQVGKRAERLSGIMRRGDYAQS